MEINTQQASGATGQKKVLQTIRLVLLLLVGAAAGYFLIGWIMPDSLFTDLKANFSRTQRLLLIPAMIIPIFFVIALHELGHLLTGLVQGFRFQLYIVGPLGVKRDEETDKIVWYFNKELNMAGGLAATTPGSDDPANIRKFARLVIAGPLTSLFLGIGLLLIDQYFSGIAGFLISVGGALSIVIFLVTIFPLGGPTFMSDGKRFLRLLTPETRSIELAIMRITATYTQTKSYDGLLVEDIELMKTDPSPMLATMAHFYAYLHYYSTGSPEKAAAAEAIYREKATELPKGFRTVLTKEEERIKSNVSKD